MAARYGFSMIELLVVIAVIMLLVTITVPSLNRAKSIGRRTVCLANLHRLTMAVNAYATKYDDVLPPDRLLYQPGKAVNAANVFENKYGRQQPRWQWFLEEGGEPAIEESRYANNAEFQAATEMSNDYFICPELTDVRYVRDIVDGAYGYNHAYLGCGRNSSSSRYMPRNWPVRMGRIFNSAETVMIGDSRGAVDGPSMSVRQNSYTLDSPRLAGSLGFTDFGPRDDIDASVDANYMHSPADARHLGMANVGFADSHAEPMSLEGLGYELDSDDMVTMDAGSNRLWTGKEDDEPNP